MSQSTTERPHLSGQDYAARVIQAILFLTLVGSVIYVLVKLITAPEISTDASVRQKSDYVLMLLQSAGGLIVMFLPAFVNRRFAIHIPSVMQILYFVFLYAAIYLGEVRDFYYRFAFWDDVLHFFSGMMLAALGFFLVRLLSDSEHRHVVLSPGFVAFFAFAFAVASGAVWEIYEFTIDGIFDTNMQKYATENGQQLIGRNALADTMGDLIMDTSAALLVCVAGYVGMRATTAKKSASAAIESQPSITAAD
ncbi:MAG TPA: hypothetical protein PKD84_11155 [Propionicimonas sp.]|nr:hypothetical protein [Propionicimonas sp.]